MLVLAPTVNLRGGSVRGHRGVVPRRPRDTAPGFHHVIVGAVDGEKYFRDDVDYLGWTRRLVRVLTRHDWACIIVMQLSTHAHAILETSDDSLSRGMQWLSAEYATDFNARHARRGTLVRSRFWSRRIRGERDLLCTYAYVAWNPVRAGVVDKPEDWPRSSYSTTLGEKTTFPFVDASAVLSLLGPTTELAIDQLRAFVNREGPRAQLELEPDPRT
jgi:putative transposase